MDRAKFHISTDPVAPLGFDRLQMLDEPLLPDRVDLGQGGAVVGALLGRGRPRDLPCTLLSHVAVTPEE